MGRLELKCNHKAGAVAEGETEHCVRERKRSMEDCTDRCDLWLV